MRRTPLERPLQLAGKPLLSADEVAAMEARAAQLFGPDADAVFGASTAYSRQAITSPSRLRSFTTRA